jgi:chromosome segregation protein
VRIKQLELIRYGRFTDQFLDLPPAAHDFHLVIGPNEAGKSTVRNAIAELLFGMKKQTPLNFIHPTQDLRLGGVLEEGQIELAFHRARGQTSLRTVTDDTPLADNHLAPLLQGITREVFEQMFGLDHGRLVQGGHRLLDANDELGQVLFESAAGLRRLRPLREQMEARAQALWAPRRTQTEFAAADTVFRAATKDLETVRVRTREWVTRKEALDAVSQQVTQARSRQQALETQRVRLERIRRIAPTLATLAVREAAMVALGHVIELPTTAHADLLTAQTEIAAAQTLLKEQERDLERQIQLRQQLIGDDAVLAIATEIESLESLRGACINHPRDLRLRSDELGRHLEAAVAAAAQLGWPTEEMALQQALPSQLTLGTVTQLLRQHGALQQGLNGARQQLTEREEELRQLQAQLDLVPLREVPAGLLVSLEPAQAFRANDIRLTQSIPAAERVAENAMLALGQWRRPIDQLRGMTLPSPERMAELQRVQASRLAEVAAARTVRDEALRAIQALRLEEQQFVQNNQVVGASEVSAARARRDEAWGAIKTKMVSLEHGTQALDETIKAADEQIDQRLGNAQATATLQSLRQRIESESAALNLKEEMLTSSEAALSEWQEKWFAVTAQAGLDGMDIADIGAWLLARQQALAADADLTNKQELVEQGRQAREAARAALTTALRPLTSLDGSEELPVLVRMAETLVATINEDAVRRGELQTQVQQKSQAVAALQVQGSTAENAYFQWEHDWQAALNQSGLSMAASSVAAAETAVALAQKVATELTAAATPRQRMQAMQADLDDLDNRAQALAQALAPERLTPGDGAQIASMLTARLTAARQTAALIAAAESAVQNAREDVNQATQALAMAKGRIQPVLAAAGVAGIEEALPIAVRSDQYRTLRNDIQALQDALARDGDGLDRTVLQEELALHPADDAVPALGQIQHDLRDLATSLDTLVLQQLEAQQGFDAVNGHADAALAEARRQEALAAMAEVAEPYIEEITALRLLRWAIDRYRDQQQGPMLSRASEVFNQLTLGAFSRLEVNTEQETPTLMARRTAGKLVEVAGLSEGTRDQLFLALRIAALEMQIASRHAMPFLADDLFVNFDDERSRAGFAALKELSARTQVIFLTHHEHLLPIVQHVLGAGVNVVRLTR